MYTVSEKNMLTSLIVFLEEEGKNELSSILQVSKFVYSSQWEFSGVVSNQRKMKLGCCLYKQKHLNSNTNILFWRKTVHQQILLSLSLIIRILMKSKRNICLKRVNVVIKTICFLLQLCWGHQQSFCYQIYAKHKLYLDAQGDATAADAFEKRVVNARCAHDRLLEFLKRANSNATLFQTLGFEDINLNFNFFDIIRQTRNDAVTRQETPLRLNSSK